jgi:hypothetical protein
MWAADVPHPRRIIYNSDGGNIFIDKGPPMMPTDVNSYVDEVAGTGVTTFFICPNYGMVMMHPSQITEMLGDRLGQEQRTRIAELAQANKGTTERAVVNLRSLVDAGHDPIGLVVDRAREKDLEVFITFRLNEIHDVEQPESLLVSSFWREHPEWRVGILGEPVSDLVQEFLGPNTSPIVGTWFPGALNFAVPEVRTLRLAELRECCERYDIDGLDLDFQRFPVYFPTDKGPEHLQTMTAWMREVREMTSEVGGRRGRPLLLSARVPARHEQCLAIGLDPVTWACDGLVDFLIISHFLRNDFPLPLAEYRDLVPDVPLYGSIEVEQTAEAYRPLARRLWQDGADGIMLFNFFTWREGGREPPFDILPELAEPAGISP